MSQRSSLFLVWYQLRHFLAVQGTRGYTHTRAQLHAKGWGPPATPANPLTMDGFCCEVLGLIFLPCKAPGDTRTPGLGAIVRLLLQCSCFSRYFAYHCYFFSVYAPP